MQELPEIARAKLRAPQSSGPLVHRPRLEAILARALQAPLLLICAPAGFGKSTLASSWFATLTSARAWLSLDADDSALSVFVYNLVLAVRTAAPAACAGTLGLLSRGQALRPGPLAVRLSNELAEIDNDLVLVLDDYHLITDPQVHEFMAALLRALPTRVHLALLTRVDPPLPLSRLRANGQMVELRGDDLRFTHVEIQAFLADTVTAPLDPALVDLIEAQTEGWAVGLRFAALSQPRSGNPAAQIMQSGANRYIMDYLFDEVLAQQPPDVQSFLITTSVLERFSPALAAALQESSDIAAQHALIEQIKKANLFLIPLDEVAGWHRYHYLFRDLLRHRLQTERSPAAIAALNQRAANWFAAQNAVPDAVRYALAAGNQSLAVQVVEVNVQRILQAGTRREIQQWLNLLPATLIDNQPALLLARMWLLLAEDSVRAWLPILQRIDVLLDEATQRPADAQPADLEGLRAELQLFWAAYWFFSNEPIQALAAAQFAFVHMPPARTYARGLTLNYLGLAHLINGRADEVFALLDREDSAANASATYLMQSNLTRMAIYWLQGDMHALSSLALRLRQAADLHNHLHLKSYSHYVLAMCYYERNELEAAIEVASSCPTVEESGNLRADTEARYAALRAQIALGDYAAAWQIFAGLESVSDRLNNEALALEVDAIRAYMWLHTGNLAQALAWADGETRTHPTVALVHSSSVCLTRTQIRIAASDPPHTQLALDELALLRQRAEPVHNRWRMIEIEAQQALALAALGKHDDALHHLEKSLDLGAPRGYVRTYLDRGAPMAELLACIAFTSPHRVYAERLLADFAEAARPPLPRTTPIYTPHSVRLGAVGLAESLTLRERDLLDCLAQRLTDKEIAATMVISVATVRTHMDNLFAKLGTRNRRDAVAQAQALGLL